MFNENKCGEGHEHMGHMMGMMGGCCSKEFMMAKLEKKSAILKIELDFMEKMKKLLEKTEFDSKK